MNLRRNISTFDRVLRIVVGIFLLSWRMVDGPIWTYLGLYLIVSGSFSHCVLYNLSKYKKLFGRSNEIDEL